MGSFYEVIYLEKARGMFPLTILGGHRAAPGGIGPKDGQEDSYNIYLISFIS